MKKQEPFVLVCLDRRFVATFSLLDVVVWISEKPLVLHNLTHCAVFPDIPNPQLQSIEGMTWQLN